MGVGAKDGVPALSVRDQLDQEAREQQLLESPLQQLNSLNLGLERSSKPPNYRLFLPFSS